MKISTEYEGTLKECQMFLARVMGIRVEDALDTPDNDKVLAVVEGEIHSDGTPGWYEATACWAGPDSGDGFIGAPVTVTVTERVEK